jgi:hypothetical protein
MRRRHGRVSVQLKLKLKQVYSTIDFVPAASGEDSYGLPLILRDDFGGSSHNRLNSAEDNEEALLRAISGPRSCGREGV